MSGDVDRRPGAVPDDDGDLVAPGGLGTDGGDVAQGSDTDGDGVPDTLLAVHGPDLLVLTDLDGDGLADRVLRIEPDGAVEIDGSPDRAVAGHVPATSVAWDVLVTRLFGLDR